MPGNYIRPSIQNYVFWVRPMHPGNPTHFWREVRAQEANWTDPLT
jgi:hypothetical protein